MHASMLHRRERLRLSALRCVAAACVLGMGPPPCSAPPSPTAFAAPSLSLSRAGLARACGTLADAQTPRATKSPRLAADTWPLGPERVARRLEWPDDEWPDDLTSLIMKFSGGGELSLANCARTTVHSPAVCHLQAYLRLQAAAKVRGCWRRAAMCGAPRTTRSSPKKWR